MTGLQNSAASAAPRCRILFVCKGSPADGLGHVTRTRAVASAASSIALVRVAVIGSAIAESMLTGAGFDYAIVSDTQAVAELSREFEPDVVVFDLLKVGGSAFGAIAGKAIAASLSPIFDSLERVGVVFHRTSISDPSWALLHNHPEFRMGLKYTVIPENCARIATPTYLGTLARDQLSVAVSLGGADAPNRTLEVVRTLKTCRQRLLLWVLLGEGYAHSYQELVEATRGATHEIILAKTNDSMWHILSSCAVAILAGGTTTCQAAFAGLPSVNMLESPDRQYLVQELVDDGACISLGGHLATSLDRLNATIEHLDASRDELMEMHLKSQRLIDGLGADRIAREILDLATVAGSFEPSSDPVEARDKR